MGSRFGGNYPVPRKNDQREKLLFVAAAGFAFSSLIIFLVVFKHKSPADANLRQQHLQPAVFPTVTLYYADRDIAPGAKFSDFGIRDKFVPHNAVPEDAVRDISELNGMYARHHIPRGAPILRSQLTRVSSSGLLPLSEGMRAVSIEVDLAARIEDFAQPGSFVDVVLTHTTENGLESRVLIESARVLSLKGKIEPSGQTPRTRDIRDKGTITLEVTPEDALRIPTAERMGSLSLQLRTGEREPPARVKVIRQPDIDGRNKGRPQKTCSRGLARIGNQEYRIDCDGTLTLLEGREP